VRSPYCPSWLHDHPMLAMPGRITCPEHVTDEPCILRVRDHLQRVAEQVAAYENDSVKHPDQAKDFLESAIRWFMDQDLVDLGYGTATGYRGGEQLDAVATLDKGHPSDWSIDYKVRRRIENSRLALHLEISYRASGSDLYQKVKSDLAKLNSSIEQCVAKGEGLPWTALVLLGPAWLGRERAVMNIVHAAYHGMRMQRLQLGDQHWWPFLDAVVMPGVLFKKHDVFATSALHGEKWPVMLPIPNSPHELRPLAIARGFLAHRVRVLTEGAEPEGESWPDCQQAAILGPCPTLPDLDPVPPDRLRGVIMRCSPAVPRTLWNRGSGYPRPYVVPMPFDVEPGVCTSDNRFRLVPRV
jgi:hypothetical protein